jgi:hypothetical protein
MKVHELIAELEVHDPDDIVSVWASGFVSVSCPDGRPRPLRLGDIIVGKPTREP